MYDRLCDSRLDALIRLIPETRKIFMVISFVLSDTSLCKLFVTSLSISQNGKLGVRYVTKYSIGIYQKHLTKSDLRCNIYGYNM